MAIQTNTAPSAFESLVRGQTSSSQNTAPRSDKFASMMDRLINEAATRKRDQVQAEASAQERRSAAASAADQAAADRTATNRAAADRAAERKAAERSPPPRPDPIRAEPAKPRQTADASPQADARAARKDEAQRTAERKDSRASDAAKAGDSAHATRTERREAAASAHATAKEAKAANAKAALDDAAKAAPAGVTVGADLAADTAGKLLPDDTNDATGDGGAGDGAGDQADDGTGEAVIIDLTVTVTETTVEMVTADQSAVLTDREAALALAVAPLVIGRPDDEADKATEDGPVEATTATTPPDAPVPDDEKVPLAGAPATDAALAAAEAASAALAAAGAPHPDSKAKPAADETVKATAAAKPVAQAAPTPVDAAPVQAVPQPEAPAPHAEAKDAAKDKPATADSLPSGPLPVADRPNDDSAPLPQSPNDLAAAKAKGATRTGADGDAGANAGNRGNPDPNGNAASLAQPPAPQAPLADPAKPAGQSAFLNAAAAAAADTPPPTDGAPHATTPTHAVFAGIEGAHTASGVETGLTTTQLRPSRGSAGLPMGVQEQVAVHISKNVSDGNDQFTINLRPAELGRIDIKLDIGQDGRVTASVAVEKAQTLELLQRDSRNLERALQDAGLKADSNSLNFSLRGEGGQSFQESGRQGGSGRRGRGVGGGTGEVEDAQAAYTLTLAPGRVDIQA
ncbi:flagellar hook-length control protein FliK [Azospirillum brasilense]|uniref:Flagellar hook-length control protein FliK n=1 Tax=Azospirillum brasilense TaxID=192 RepID=A0A560AVF3_AZOBR|nr:flagellar hook-length control protein FliK [Azospirillum brasilense]TWA64353.1 flagellar hook-length control protein FliK [Azospirillum brasilense]